MKFESDFSIAYSQKRSVIWKSVETVAITLLLWLLATKLQPNDPYSLAGPIPWILFLPVFCSLFYGAIYGVLSILILLVILVFQQPIDAFQQPLLREYMLGGISLTLLTALFSSYWVSRIRHVEHLNRYVREHLEDLSRDYYLLRISHERIEQAYIIKPLSLRDAFFQLKQDTTQSQGEINAANCHVLLGIFSQFCSINHAAFCLYDEKSQILEPIDFFGQVFEISAEDPLIQKVIKEKTTSYFAINHLVEKNKSDYLAIIPLLTTERKMIGMVIIKDMPFWSLTHDNLEALSVFAAYFAMQLSIINRIKPLLKQFPSCPSGFLDELQTLVYLKKHHGVNSGISCVIIPEGPHQENITYIMEQQKRALDYIWIFPVKSAKLIMTLMPLTSKASMLGYKTRIMALLKNDFGLILNHEGLNFRFRLLAKQKESTQLQEFIKEVIDAVE